MKASAPRLLLLLVLATLAADQATKYLAVSRLTHALEGREGAVARLQGFVDERHLERRASGPHVVLPEYWNFRYVENPGAAWGMFGNLPEGVRRPFFHLVSLAALGFLFWMYRGLGPGQGLLRAALALVAGGALGNFVDRLLRGYVIDFIDWHWRNQPGMRWPTFNVADMAIVVGVGLLALESLRGRRVTLAGAAPAPLNERAIPE
jgi:signal peptidase II